MLADFICDLRIEIAESCLVQNPMNIDTTYITIIMNIKFWCKILNIQCIVHIIFLRDKFERESAASERHAPKILNRNPLIVIVRIPVIRRVLITGYLAAMTFSIGMPITYVTWGVLHNLYFLF